MEQKQTNQKNKALSMGLGIIGGFLLVCMVLLAALTAQPAPIYADTVPTPSNWNTSAEPSTLNVTFWSSDAQTASEASAAAQMPKYGSLILHYVIDQATATNTLTIKTQWLNDPTCASAPSSASWSDGPDLVTANAADADGIVQQANLGRCTRLYNTVTNTNSVTISVWGLAR